MKKAILKKYNKCMAKICKSIADKAYTRRRRKAYVRWTRRELNYTMKYFLG